MKLPAYRACPIHRDEIIGHDTAGGREIIMCRQGHELERWIVIDSAGEIILEGSVHPPKNTGTKEKKHVVRANRSRRRS
jgi:hypothetical protein